jgi:hypothetical protein
MNLRTSIPSFVFAVIIFGCQLAHGQSAINGFLLSAYQDSEVKSIDAQIQYLNSKPYRLAPINQVQFRTESNQLDPDRQEYALRVNPANPWEVKNNNRYFRDYRTMLELKRDMALEEALHDRYLLAVDLLYQRELTALRKKDIEIGDAYIKVLENQKASDYFDAKDYVDLKLDQIDRAVEAEEASFEMDDVMRQMSSLHALPSQQDSAWNDQPLLSFETLIASVDSLFNAQQQSMTMAYHEQRINLLKTEYALEKSNINVGFLQAKYENFRIDQGRHPWSVGMGVTIPIFNPNKGDMTKRKIEIMEEEQEKEEISQEDATGSLRTREQIKSQLARYQGIQEKIKTLSSGPMVNTLRSIEGNNPAVQLRLNSNILKLEIIALKLKQSILYTYVEFLCHVDAIQQRPLINYLSETRMVIER